MSVPQWMNVADDDRRRLEAGEHSDPHRFLGAHVVDLPDARGLVIRAWRPGAVRAKCLWASHKSSPMTSLGDFGLFGAFVKDAQFPFDYEMEFEFADGVTEKCFDPYSFPPTLGDWDLHLFNEGRHHKLWEKLGAHCCELHGVPGTAFAVWAPSAQRVSVVGDFCQWDGKRLPMRQMGSSGVFELFVPGVSSGAYYKYEIKTSGGDLRIKCDPMGSWMQQQPGTASRVFRSSYAWNDESWTARRKTTDWRREPISMYEVHLGSWARVPEEGDRFLTYREIAPRLAQHVRQLGMTHIQLMPIAEHPFTGSWGYQVTGYYAPTSRFGDPDDFRCFVDVCHQHGIGVILDWVPAHFPKDDFALRKFDGAALYEHEDSRQGEHPDWGTLIFNYGRNEVRSFLLANALYWLEEFHIDGLRVDAVASMLYLDYSRRPGEWIPNRFGGKENLDAMELLRSVNNAVDALHGGFFTVAEESTGWFGVTAPTSSNGLGFTFKWNMGWMHDTLKYFEKDPVHRPFHHNELTFAMLYEHTERFINPLSHDEVVHGKRSLLEKMPGDFWQKFANLRTLLAYQFTRPGKNLIFMGTELAPHAEWNVETSLDWRLEADPMRQGFRRFVEELGALYKSHSPFWRKDPDGVGFRWIDCEDHSQSVISYERRDGSEFLLIVLNLTPVPRQHYRIGAPEPGEYHELLCSDAARFGGSGFPTPPSISTEGIGAHGSPQSLNLSLAPLAALVLQRKS